MLPVGPAMWAFFISCWIREMPREQLREHLEQAAPDQRVALFAESAQAGHSNLVVAALPLIDVNAKYKDEFVGCYALQEAACGNHAETVRVLLPKVDVNAAYRDKNGRTTVGGHALIEAARNGRAEIVGALLSRIGLEAEHQEGKVRTTVGGYALIEAVSNWHTEVMRMLLPKVNLKADYHYYSYHEDYRDTTVGGQAFIVAAQEGYVGGVEALLSKVDLSDTCRVPSGRPATVRSEALIRTIKNHESPNHEKIRDLIVSRGHTNGASGSG